MKKLCSILLALCLLLGLCACGKSAPAETPTEAPATTAPTTAPTTEPTTEPVTEPVTEPTTDPVEEPDTASSISPLLYKVTDADGNVAWLFGSIHVGQDYFYPLPDYVTNAYESADALAVEADMVAFESDLSAQTAALSSLVYMDGTMISDHISEDLYNRSVEILEENNTYMSLLDVYYPIMWSSLIESFQLEAFELDTDLGIDMYFLNDAYDTGKEIREVESVQFQYDMMGNFSPEIQAAVLEGSVYSYDHPEESEADYFELMDAWAQGNAEELSALLNEVEFESDEEKALYEEYNDAMVTQRNISMADFAEEALASGKEVFICVGAAHVVGPGAMADLLTQRGYTVEVITN